MTSDPIDRSIVQPAAAAAAGRSHRWWAAVGGLFLLAMAGLGVVLIWQHQEISALGSKLGTVQQSSDNIAAQADQLAAQVRSLGASPVVIPPSPGQAGQAGPPGSAGQNGVNGIPGLPGRDGTTPACLSTPSQCVGPAGTNGSDGTNGTDGAAGQPGTDGSDGAPGAPGIDGKDGKDGQPPASWTTTYPDGSVQTCTRSDNFDPASPTYTCSVQTPDSPTPTPSSGLAVLPAITRRSNGRTQP